MNLRQLPLAWWAPAYQREHFVLISFAESCRDRGLNWAEELSRMWAASDPTLSPELIRLRDALGARIFQQNMCLLEGDGVSLTRFGRFSPATVREVGARSITVTLDLVRTRLVSGDTKRPAYERVLFIPSDKTALVFTRRSDGAFRLKENAMHRILLLLLLLTAIGCSGSAPPEDVPLGGAPPVSDFDGLYQVTYGGWTVHPVNDLGETWDPPQDEPSAPDLYCCIYYDKKLRFCSDPDANEDSHGELLPEYVALPYFVLSSGELSSGLLEFVIVDRDQPHNPDDIVERIPVHIESPEQLTLSYESETPWGLDLAYFKFVRFMY